MELPTKVNSFIVASIQSIVYTIKTIGDRYPWDLTFAALPGNSVDFALPIKRALCEREARR
jgi:hypothetical protein